MGLAICSAKIMALYRTQPLSCTSGHLLCCIDAIRR